MHSLGIVHRDLKLQNIVVSKSSLTEPKIVDFGFARRGLMVSEGSSRCGTLGYMAPELLSFGKKDKPVSLDASKADVWALGVILYYLMLKKYPFKGNLLSPSFCRVSVYQPDTTQTL